MNHVAEIKTARPVIRSKVATVTTESSPSEGKTLGRAGCGERNAIRAWGAAIRRGFTLVELLVVLAIIAILAGLGIPAVMMALRTANEFEITTDITQLTAGVETFRNEQKLYPPDGYYDVLEKLSGTGETTSTADDWIDPDDPNIATLLIQRYGPFLQKFAPNHREFVAVPGSFGSDADLPIVAWYRRRGQFLNPTNSLNFWLGGGMSESKIFPLSEELQRDSESATDYANRVQNYKALSYFDFGRDIVIDPLALWDTDQVADLGALYGFQPDGSTPNVPAFLRSAVQPGTDRPYLYFTDGNSPLYLPYILDASTTPLTTKYVPVAETTPTMTPMYFVDPVTSQVRLYGEGTFQIISAGLDELYGNGNPKELRDNLVSFAGGKRVDSLEENQGL